MLFKSESWLVRLQTLTPCIKLISLLALSSPASHHPFSSINGAQRETIWHLSVIGFCSWILDPSSYKTCDEGRSQSVNILLKQLDVVRLAKQADLVISEPPISLLLLEEHKILISCIAISLSDRSR